MYSRVSSVALIIYAVAFTLGSQPREGESWIISSPTFTNLEAKKRAAILEIVGRFNELGSRASGCVRRCGLWMPKGSTPSCSIS